MANEKTKQDKLEFVRLELLNMRHDLPSIRADRLTQILDTRPSEIPEHIYTCSGRVVVV